MLTELERMQPFLYELGTTIALLSEMAERRQVEKDLKEAKEHAEVASQTKSRFLAKMSHENPDADERYAGYDRPDVGYSTDG